MNMDKNSMDLSMSSVIKIMNEKATLAFPLKGCLQLAGIWKIPANQFMVFLPNNIFSIFF